MRTLAPLPFLALASSAHGATLVVPTQHGTIQAAVDAAIAGDIVAIAPGTYVEDVDIPAGKDLTIRGAGPEQTFLVAYGSGLAAIEGTLASLTVEGMTIDSENAVGGIRLTTANDVVLRDLAMIQPASAFDGGAVSLADADSILIDSVTVNGAFSGNNGGVYLTAVPNVTIVRSVFCDSTSDDGSGIYVTGGSGTIANNVFVDNLGNSAVFLDDGDWSVTHNAFLANSGTALQYNSSGNLTVQGNQFYLSDTLFDPFGATLVESHNSYGSWGSFDIRGATPDATSLTNYNPDFLAYPGHGCRLDDFLPPHDYAYFDFAADTDLDGTPGALGPAGGPDAPAHWWVSGDGDPSERVYDCDDTDPNNYPGNDETCALPGDNDCDGLADDDEIYEVDGTVDATYFHEDLDGDGYGSDQVGAYVIACDNPDPSIYVTESFDCDDTNPYRNPGVPEVCLDGIDNNCDGATDDATAIDALDWYTDEDGDSYGAAGETPITACVDPGPAYGNPRVNQAGDCQPTDAAVNPGAEEVCDGIDNDCQNGEFFAVDATTWVPDIDGDGYAAEGKVGRQVLCESPGKGWIDLTDSLGDDCNDGDTTVFPGNPEICDGLDNDCNGTEDDLPGTPTTVYTDLDGDGFGSDVSERSTHCPTADEVTAGGDCDDGDAARAPDLPELCDGIDNDCVGGIDDGPATTWHEDFDEDGFGNPDAFVEQQCGPEGYVDNGDDCADGIADVNPAAEEVPGNDVDENCDGDAPGASSGPGGEPYKEGNQGCQCDSTAPPALGWLLLPVGLLARRRRAR